MIFQSYKSILLEYVLQEDTIQVFLFHVKLNVLLAIS